MFKTKIWMMLVLLLATSVEAGSPKSAEAKQEQAQAQPNDHVLRDPVQPQQEEVAIQQAAPYFSEGSLDQILTTNLTSQILGYLSFPDCMSLALSGPKIQKKIRRAVPHTFRTSEVSEMLLNAKPGMFYEIYSEARYEVPDIDALSKNAPHLHLRRMTATVLDVKNLLNSDKALTPEVIECLKDLDLPLAGPIELLQHKELWPQVCVLSLDVNRPEYPVELLRTFAEQENRRLTLMIKCNVPQIIEDELIRKDYLAEIINARMAKKRDRVRGIYQMFFSLIDLIERWNLGIVREVDCILSSEHEAEFWSEQFSHLLEKKCFQDLRGYHFAQSPHGVAYAYDFRPLQMLSHLPSSIESLSMPADFLLDEIMPYLPFDHKGLVLNPDLPPDETGQNIVNCLKKMHSLKEYNFSCIFGPQKDADNAAKQLYALIYFPKDIFVRGKAYATSDYILTTVLNHFSRLDDRFEVSFQFGLCQSNDLIAEALKKHPLIKKHWSFFDPGSCTLDAVPKEITQLRILPKDFDFKEGEGFADFKNLKKLRLSYTCDTWHQIKSFFTSCHQSLPKHIVFDFMNWKTLDLLADSVSHLQNLEKLTFALDCFDSEESQYLQKFFDSLSPLRSLKVLSFKGDYLTGAESLEALKTVPGHIEKLKITMKFWNVLESFPEELFALSNLKELSLRVLSTDYRGKRDAILDKFVVSLGNMKSLQKVTLIYPHSDMPAPFLSEKALIGVKKVYRLD